MLRRFCIWHKSWHKWGGSWYFSTLWCYPGSEECKNPKEFGYLVKSVNVAGTTNGLIKKDKQRAWVSPAFTIIDLSIYINHFRSVTYFTFWMIVSRKLIMLEFDLTNALLWSYSFQILHFDDILLLAFFYNITIDSLLFQLTSSSVIISWERMVIYMI